MNTKSIMQVSHLKQIWNTKFKLNFLYIKIILFGATERACFFMRFLNDRHTYLHNRCYKQRHTHTRTHKPFRPWKRKFKFMWSHKLEQPTNTVFFHHNAFSIVMNMRQKYSQILRCNMSKGMLLFTDVCSETTFCCWNHSRRVTVSGSTVQ